MFGAFLGQNEGKNGGFEGKVRGGESDETACNPYIY